MNRFNIPIVASGLTAYAIERQNGWERHAKPGAPSWTEQRRFWTDAILQGMARLEDGEPDPRLMEQYDHELEQAHGSAATVPASPKLQKETISSLHNFVSALEATGGDRRRQVNAVWELLEDMASHLPWSHSENGLDHARDNAEQALARMTARVPICFTRILLGGDAGPCWASGFAPGSVTDIEAVKQTDIYQDAVRVYPEITNWPALCTVYLGGGPSVIGAVDAVDFDIKIIQKFGDDFLKQPALKPAASCQLCIPVYEQIQVLKVEPGRAPEVITMPNTLEALQAAVGGDIEAVGLDSDVCLVCNELGKLIGLPTNRRVNGDTIAGTFLIVGDADGEFCSLSEEDAAYYAQELSEPLPSHGQPTQWEFRVL